jgi:hypothetical protein
MKDEDIASQWIEDCCKRVTFDVRNPDRTRSSIGRLHGSLNKWCADNGHKPLCVNWLSNRLAKLGFVKQRSGPGRYILGLVLAPSPSASGPPPSPPPPDDDDNLFRG